MQMDREKSSLGGKSAQLMTLDEVPKFVFEQSSQAKSATVSDEEGLDDIMDARQRRRLLRKSHAQSEVGAAGWQSLRCTHAADMPALSSICVLADFLVPVPPRRNKISMVQSQASYHKVEPCKMKACLRMQASDAGAKSSAATPSASQKTSKTSQTQKKRKQQEQVPCPPMPTTTPLHAV